MKFGPPYPDEEHAWLEIPIGPSLDPIGDRAKAEQAIEAGAKILRQRPVHLPQHAQQPKRGKR